MLNLIIKDVVIQKKTILFALFYTIFASISFSSMKPDGFGLYVLAPIVVVYLFITTAVGYDEKNKSEIVLNSLPLKRDDIVISKYISIFIFVIIGIIYSILIGFVGKFTGLPMFNRSISLLDIISTLTSVCMFSSIFFPVYFKFGLVKMKVFNIVLFMLMFFLPTITVQYVIENPNNTLVQKFNYFINNTSNLMQNSLVLILGLICFLVSLLISIRIYNKKEF